MNDIFVCLLLLTIAVCIVSVIGFIVKWITKKPKKKWGIFALSAFVSFWAIGIVWGIVSPSHSDNNNDKQSETIIEETESKQPDNAKIEETDSKQDSTVQQEPGDLEKQPLPPNTQQPPEQEETESGIDTSVTFSDIYNEYKSNELRAKELYQGNRYQITAKINGMKTSGLFNLTGGATLTMEYKCGNTIVFFYAEFEREQEEKLKQVSVGDTITFTGVCYGGNFTDCKMQ